MKTKRVVDIVLGAVCAAVALPFVILLAVGCAVSLRAWPFFVQRRVGKDGRLFALPKLRTLPTSAPRTADKYQLDGTRIPRFCQLLRRTHVDELPQLFVVPLGWMSLVGPRPEMPNLLARYPEDFVAARCRIRPGCTGLWQVSNSSGRLIYEAPEYDLAYVDNCGVRLDAWILYRTLRMWLTGGDAIDLDGVPDWAWVRPPVTPTYVDDEIDLRDDASTYPEWSRPGIELTLLQGNASLSDVGSLMPSPVQMPSRTPQSPDGID
ncbi:MAG: hypothetical protein JWL83_4785 [Actinomycetia bacterium]|nr:hypothetical protein [Actinomycetes bacterium]